jgi:hypothetical protein
VKLGRVKFDARDRSRQFAWRPSNPEDCRGLLFGYELSQVTQQIVAQFRKAIDFFLGVDCVQFAQPGLSLFGRGECVQVPGKASGTGEEISNLPLKRSVEQIQAIGI